MAYHSDHARNEITDVLASTLNINGTKKIYCKKKINAWHLVTYPLMKLLNCGWWSGEFRTELTAVTTSKDGNEV